MCSLSRDEIKFGKLIVHTTYPKGWFNKCDYGMGAWYKMMSSMFIRDVCRIV
jgi:hypothetical protein